MSSETIKRQDQLLTMLERLLELPLQTLDIMLQQAVQQSIEVLTADKMDIFFLDSTNETLVARSVSDTPMGRRQRAIGMDRLPLANGGRTVEVFLTGISYFNNRVHEDPDELVGIKVGLNVKSQIAAAFKVRARHRGVVLVASETPDFFSPQDVRFLEAVARWVGTVVGRAELAERMGDRDVELDRMPVTEELLTIMAHDLRNYLTPLEGRLDLMRERASREGREKDVRDAESTIHTLNLLARSISDLLDIARLNQGLFVINPQPMNLVEMVQNVGATFDGKHVPISIQSPEEVIVTADPERLRQALENMLVYLVSQASERTRIIVEVAIEHRIDGPWVLVVIKYVGSALSKQFSSLYQPSAMKSESINFSLGLYLTNQIALAHQGALTIASPDAHETWLTFAFPVEDEELIVNGQEKFLTIK